MSESTIPTLTLDPNGLDTPAAPAAPAAAAVAEQPPVLDESSFT